MSRLATLSAMTAAVMLLTGCGVFLGKSTPHTAVVSRAGTGCRLTIEGFVPNMAHDPLSLIFAGRSKLYEILDVPRLEGVIATTELTLKYADEYGRDRIVKNLTGSVSFDADSVTINLSTTQGDGALSPVYFDGIFSLKRWETCP